MAYRKRQTVVLGCFVWVVFSCLPTSAQSTKSQPYDYPTRLKGGYRLVYRVKREIMFLYLAKGRKVITELNSCSVGLLSKNLGYIARDYDNRIFVFAKSYGSGNPHEIRLIEKSTGKDLIESDAIWIDSSIIPPALVYARDVPRRPGGKIVLFDIATRRKQAFVLPDQIFDDNEVYSRISVERLNARKLVIRYEVGGHSTTKTYRRN